MARVIELTPAVAERFPDMEVWFFKVDVNALGVTSTDEAAREEEVYTEAHKVFPDVEALESHPFEDLYRRFYSSMGLKARKVSTPVRQAARILRQGYYRSRGVLVDSCMLVEYTSLASFQAYDYDRVTGSLAYSLAGGTEHLTTFQGEEKQCKEGELVLRDEEGVLHSSYYGNASRASVSEATALGLVRALRIPGFPAPDFDQVIQRSRERLQPLDELKLSRSVTSGEL